VTHYGKIVVALKETIRLMGEIDAVIPSWPIEWVLRRRRSSETSEVWYWRSI